MSNTDIVFSEHTDVSQKKLACITLNRPKALNALSKEMFVQLRAHLEKWEKDPAVKAVFVHSSSEKAFCAGGDIRAVYENKNQSPEKIAEYFALEYGVNQIIYHFKKPYVALLNGITMGGGVGISVHGTCSVSTETLRWAMPETLIGFFPDVGTAYRLSRLPDYIGVYLGLTGASITVHDAVALGLVQYFVPEKKCSALEKALRDTTFDENSLVEIIQSFSEKTQPSMLLVYREIIKQCFSFSHVAEILEALEKEGSDWSRNTLGELQKRSPTSLHITRRQLQEAATMTFDEVIAMDVRIATEILHGHDFFEGIRAAIVDKDRQPRWQSF